MPRPLALLLALGAALAPAAAAQAHGGMSSPPQRQVVCRFLDRDAEPCARAWRENPQALYDWMEVNIGDADGRHRALIADGELCSAGREKYAAFDRPSLAWPASPLRPGRQALTYDASPAPHATRYFRLYLTREGFDPRRPLRWDDLELIHDSGAREASAEERFSVDVPQRTGRHILYVVWQRSDSPEAFYGCSDVTFDGPGTVAPATATPVTDPDHDGHRETGGGRGGAPTAGQRLRIARETTSDWGAGYCAKVTVANRGRRAARWRATVPATGTIASIWDARGSIRAGRLRARGLDYNRVLRPGARTSFGFCADR
ncbi:MAG TPA: lytic polysaccharide monooxygenase [Capillimicrobium sp.]|jgi:chitin-binding protein